MTSLFEVFGEGPPNPRDGKSVIHSYNVTQNIS